MSITTFIPKDILDIPAEEFDAPLFQALMEYVRLNPARFHMPGHKKGAGIPPEVAQTLRESILAMDITETRGMDNLHSPSGCIKKAQDLAAQTFGADRTWFLTNGTTAGVHAMIMVTCKQRQKIIIPRDAHLAVIGGVILCGLRPIFVYPDIDPEWGISLGVRPEAYEEALTEHPDAKACLITRPNYYGIAEDLTPLVEACRKRDIPLLVDEAHGPHIHFHEDLPPSALDYGASMVVQSTHKMLGSFTGSSMLHMKGTSSRIYPDRVQRMLAILQSTSPSYLLMMSLDIAATVMRKRGHQLMARALALSQRVRDKLKGLPGVRVLERPSMDRLKLTVSMINLGLAGFDLKNKLIDEYNVRVELADLENVIAFITYADTEETVDALANALTAVAREAYEKATRHGNGLNGVKADKHLQRGAIGTQAIFTRHLFAPAEQRLLPREATLAAHELVSLERAEGRTCAEVVAPYPPGIPLLYPGEVIDAGKIGVIDEALSLGAVFRGLNAEGDLMITVVRE
ncbi:MAG: aminotransferase class I/II-fold pyridoxal phosphate-dependent enzyme [Firmicutes bacterium]|nr:aminotransferase class I/II-fold pyridoxal phosphate-dependent enzyme [Bacillota bacterium]